MEYLHPLSAPATKSELELFRVPPTQTAIESKYEVEYRPTSSLESTKTLEFIIPPSDDFTDLSTFKIYAQVKISPNFTKAATEEEKKEVWET